MIDAYASFPHYLSHIVPIWHALDESIRGTFYIASSLVADAQHHGIEAQQGRPSSTRNPIIVAAYADYRSNSSRPVIFVEHGAGQVYSERENNPSYSGGAMRDRVVLFICPNETVAGRNQARYPTIPVAIVGCPRLDAYYPIPPRIPHDPLVVAFAFHADYSIAPETRSAFRQFHTAIPLVRDAGYHVIGHAHPRLYRRVAPVYAKYGVDHTEDPDEVLGRADCLVVDNSSFGFEAAAVGVPIVWMSPTFYRREVKQWPRFWDALVLGPEATRAEGVLAAVTEALAPVSLDVQSTRDNFLSTIYSYRDKQASHRAAEAIMAVIGA